MHHVDLDVLQIADPALQRLQLAEHPLQRLGVGDRAGVDHALVTLAATKGTAVQLIAEGEDASSAATALAGLIEDRFGEDR